VNNEPERIWKETLLFKLEVLSRHLPEGTKKNAKKRQDGRHAGPDYDWAPPNSNQKRYRLSHLAR
jgi:hypothetical protein